LFGTTKRTRTGNGKRAPTETTSKEMIANYRHRSQSVGVVADRGVEVTATTNDRLP